ncbi:hypothetical protein [Chitinimonas sp.]|uniref:hypothetical protein n=1 Tax=Chitinimonas sp. TaxID=1934313 RepID=UPI002F94BDFD
MSLPQPTPDNAEVAWFSLADGLLGLGWLVTAIVAVLLLVGLAALWQLFTGSRRTQASPPTLQEKPRHARAARWRHAQPPRR